MKTLVKVIAVVSIGTVAAVLTYKHHKKEKYIG